MNATSGTRSTRTLAERLLITKIVTGVGLVLLLVIGVWAATHPGSDTATAAASAPTTVADTAPGNWDAVTAERAAPAALITSDAGGVVAGVAGCVLGVLCCLMLLALITLFALRAPPRVTAVTRRTSAPPFPADRRFTPALSLSQLSLSRT